MVNDKEDTDTLSRNENLSETRRNKENGMTS